MLLPSQSLKSVWSLFVTSCSLPWPWVKVKAPGSWWLVVVGLGDSSGGYSFTTHCAAGLLFDAGVVPLAAEEMSCLLPFPYTPKPNEQHGAHLQHFLHPRYKDLPFPPPGSFLTLAPLYCGRSVSFSSPIFFFFFIPPTIQPSNHLFILLCFHEACFLSRSAHPSMWPHHSEAGGQWPGMASEAKVRTVTLPWHINSNTHRDIHTHTHTHTVGATKTWTNTHT